MTQLTTELALRTEAEEILDDAEKHGADLVLRGDLADELAYLLGVTGGPEEPNRNTIRHLLADLKFANDVIAVLIALRNSPFIAIDALPRDEQGSFLVERGRLKELQIDRNSLSVSMVGRFARYFGIGDELSIDETGLIFKPPHERGEGDDFEDLDTSGFERETDRDDFIGDCRRGAEFEETDTLSIDGIREALELVRGVFPMVRMELALERVLNFAEAEEIDDLESALRNMCRYYDIYEELLDQSGGPSNPEESALARDTVQEAAREQRSSLPQVSDTPGSVVYSPADLLVRITERASLQTKIKQNSSDEAPDYHYREPVADRSLDCMNPLLVCGISPQMIGTLGLNAEDVAFLVQRNLRIILRMSHEHPELAPPDQLAKLIALRKRCIGEGGKPNLDLVTSLMGSLEAGPKPEAYLNYLASLKEVGDAQVTSALEARLKLIEYLAVHKVSTKPVRLTLINESAALNDMVSGESCLKAALDEVVERVAGPSKNNGHATSLETERAFLERFLASQKLKVSVGNNGILSGEARVRRHERVLGTIDITQTGFETFRQLLEANGFSPSKVAGFLASKSSAVNTHNGEPSLQYHLDGIPLSDFSRLLRFVRTDRKPGALLFSIVTLPKCTPYVRLVGRISETSPEEPNSTSTGSKILHNTAGTPLPPRFSGSNPQEAAHAEVNELLLAGITPEFVRYFGLGRDEIKKLLEMSFGSWLAELKRQESDTEGGAKYSQVSALQSELLRKDGSEEVLSRALADLIPAQSFQDRIDALHREIEGLGALQKDIERSHAQVFIDRAVKSDGYPLQDLVGKNISVLDEALALDYAFVTVKDRDCDLLWQAAMEFEESDILNKVNEAAMSRSFEYCLQIDSDGRIHRASNGKVDRNATERIIGAINLDEEHDMEAFRTLLKQCLLFDEIDGTEIDPGVVAASVREINDEAVRQVARSVNLGTYRTRDLSREEFLLLSMHLEPVCRPGAYLFSRSLNSEGEYRYHLVGRLPHK